MREDYTNKTFYRLTGIKFSRKFHNALLWFWRCSCGNMTEADPSKVKSGKTKSCGCYRVDLNQGKVPAMYVVKKKTSANRGNAAWQELGKMKRETV